MRTGWAARHPSLPPSLKALASGADRSRWGRVFRSLRVLARVSWHFLPLWPWVLGMVLASVAAISAELAEPLLHQQLVNRVLLGHSLRLLPRILVLYVAVATAHWLAGSLAHYCHVQGGERFSIRLRTRTYAHLRRLSLRALRRESSGELVAAMQQFGPEVGEGYLGLLHAVTSSLYRLPASLALLARLNGQLLWMVLPALALYPLYPVATVRPLRRALTALTLYDVQAQGVVNDRVVGLPAMLHRVDAREDVTAVRDLLWRRLPLRVRVFLVERLGGLFDVAAHQGVAVLLFGLGGLAVLQGRMSVGALLAFMEYVRGLEVPVRRLMHLPIGAQRVAVVADRVYALLDRPVDVPGPRRGRSAARLRGEVRLQGVTVRGDDGRPLLRDVSFTVPAGALCAVVGASGAGKSTLGVLVPRFIDPDAGQVLLDGVDARSYDLASLRQAVAYVPQDPIFFRDSVWENLVLARPEASAREVWQALQRARATDFLQAEALRTAGAETAAAPPILGLGLAEGAANLSGGQRQRLGLARGFLQGGRILVLDEVLSGLDPVLQREVFRGIAALRGRQTVLLITHQWDLARQADLVVLLAEGRLVRCGRPEAVLGRF
jgi:ABC-type bacteriocin/lantibiotic exporter with double-glycine peptidase domain